METSQLLRLSLAILSVLRLAEIISIDTISEPVRKRIGKMVTRKGGIWWWVSEWVNCPYCVGVWLALPLAIIIGGGEWWLYWFAIAGGQSILESLVNVRD
jgi:hypothetical protein